MRQKNRKFIVLASLLAFALMACNMGQVTTPTVMEPVVITYEGAAIALNTWKAYIKGQEISGTLKSPELDNRIKEWEMARQIFLKAGDVLKAALNAPDKPSMNVQMSEFNRLLSNLALEIGKAKVPANVKTELTTQMKGGAK